MTWWLAPLVVAAAVASVTPRVLLALPAPIDEPDSRPCRRATTPPCGCLTTFLLVGVAGVVVAALAPAAAAVSLAGSRLPPVYWRRWSMRAPAICRLVLMRVGWVLTLGSLIAATASTNDWQLLARAAGGALAATALFYTFHRRRRRFRLR